MYTRTKHILSLLLLCTALFALALCASAETVTGSCGDNLTYTLDTDTGVLTITGTGKMWDFSGETNDDFAPWFGNRAPIRKVRIGDGVTSIGEGAFWRCSALESVIIPDGVTRIESWAFQRCTALESVTIPSSVTDIGGGVFSGCSNLAAIRVESGNPNYVAQDGVLFDKAMTTLLQAPGRLSGAYTVPSGVEIIGAQAFRGCSGLISARLPKSVTEIQSLAFVSCSQLAEIHVDAGNPVFAVQNDALVNTQTKTLVCVPAAKTGTYTIPSGITVVGQVAFYACADVTAVEFPAGVQSIDDEAFVECTGLTEMVLPEGLTEIRDYAFAGCTNLTSITVPASVTNIWDWAFSDCPATLTVTRGSAAYDYAAKNGIPFVTTDGEVGILASGACGDNLTWKLDAVGVLTITGTGKMRLESDAPWSTYRGSISKVCIEEGVTSIGENAFGDCYNLADIAIPDSVISIGDDAFQFCTSLEALTIPQQTTDIGDWAFHGCYALADLAVDDGNPNYMSLDGVLFSKDGTKLIYVTDTPSGTYTIPDGVTTIGVGAFCFRSKITCIRVPESLAEIGFSGFTGAGLIEVDAGNPYFVNRGGVLFSKDGTELIHASNTLSGVYVIPDGVTSIREYAFSDCTSLTEAVMPDSVAGAWGTGIFLECTALQKVTLSKGLTAIGTEMFNGCTALQSITIPESVAEIWDFAFGNCTSLREITILNADCRMADADTIIDEAATIYGYDGSTAEDYAKKYDREFVSLGERPHAHTYARSFTVDQPATCVRTGIRSRHCTHDGCTARIDIRTIPVDQNAHDFAAEFTVDVEPNCTETGVKSRHCKRCDARTDETVVPVNDDHDYSTAWTVDISATCTAPGSKSHHCTRCDAKTDITEIPATGKHTYVDGVCKDCGAEKPPYTPGDCNDDGKITKADLLRLQKYLAGWEVEINLDAADCNGDGKVTKADLLRLQKYLAGWDVKLGE